MKEITVLPHLIRQSYNADLLSMPFKMREDSETLWKAWQYIEKLWHKLDKCPAKKAKCEELKKQFMELYERAKAKEEERKATPKHRTQVSMYFIGFISRKGEEAFRRAKYGRRVSDESRVSRKYGKIYKVQALNSRVMKEYGKHVKITELL